MVDDQRDEELLSEQHYEDLANIREPELSDEMRKQREEQRRERDDLNYPYKEHWGHIDEIVNPERQAKGLDLIDRETADVMCRILVNFHVGMYEKHGDNGNYEICRKYYKDPAKRGGQPPCGD